MTNVLLVGAGIMAKEYAKVLKAMNIPFMVVGRSEQNAKLFEMELSIPVIAGGIENVFDKIDFPTHAIIATNLESLEENTIFLLQQGVKNILVEKPGSVTKEGLSRIATLSKKKNSNVYIAYNRRFYASVLEAKKRIELDGGLTSFLFEFTEWAHKITALNKTTFQLENWFIGNSTHVIDTAFFFGGKPKKISTYVQSNLEWHPKGSIYTGAGITEKDILFSYHANWNAPGSWKLELLTENKRYIFRPFEKLYVQKKGSVEIEEIQLNNKLDILYKPGLYKQTEAFLNSITINLLEINEAIENMKFYEQINSNAGRD